MNVSQVMRGGTDCAAPAPAVGLRVVLAFAAIYFLWGATFLAIRIAVLEVPPLFASGVRFLIPGALFWAEQYVSSGITAVIEATLPITTATFEVFVFRQQAFRWRVAAAVALGFCGVAALLIRSDPQTLPLLPCLAILAGGVAWSLGAVLTRSMPRPQSVPLAAGAQMMLGGAVLLGLSQASGELQSLPHVSLRAGLALAYLVIAGSLLGFTAYVWVVARMPATRVASHAYVNPLVAVALGYFLAGEVLTVRTILAAALVVASVFLILTAPDARRRRWSS